MALIDILAVIAATVVVSLSALVIHALMTDPH